jgi:PadR family transcriptional regulator PadR
MKTWNYLGQHELMVMLAVLRLKDEAYGVPIAKQIGATTGREVLLGSIYATLERLEKKGFVASQLGEATAVRGGRAKTFFRVTPKGLKQVREAQQALQALWKGLPQLGFLQT